MALTASCIPPLYLESCVFSSPKRYAFTTDFPLCGGPNEKNCPLGFEKSSIAGVLIGKIPSFREKKKPRYRKMILRKADPAGNAKKLYRAFRVNKSSFHSDKLAERAT